MLCETLVVKNCLLLRILTFVLCGYFGDVLQLQNTDKDTFSYQLLTFFSNILKISIGRRNRRGLEEQTRQKIEDFIPDFPPSR